MNKEIGLYAIGRPKKPKHHCEDYGSAHHLSTCHPDFTEGICRAAGAKRRITSPIYPEKYSSAVFGHIAGIQSVNGIHASWG